MRPARSGLPKGWPQGLVYITAPVYSRLCAAEVQKSLHTPSAVTDVLKVPSGPSPLARITKIGNPSHPANGQSGLFAAQHLPPDTFIILYLGLFHTREDADPDSDYDLSLDRELGVGIDATRMGNEARFINDYRGVGPPGPNAEFREVWIDAGRGKMERRMGVFVLSAGKSGKRAKGIAKGDEILVSYGKGFWSERQKEQDAATDADS
ncbi:uncharacterized protein K452DRAFT_304140 [Aplosporella prunicola CBS 121167]|uniref:SET domain-containing protein n=1 Tax=Aplosporella prunicola CBS 121167 TaxID=1176127 RepID=A0A6A6BT21_9PEZI|nr:uncharacterized protein K452DRAFT_304140 [Aplosporella prunicola CBS 121167]KAF2147272.1 hypothetical protein K452DRAFT_304140 [Aplosporella prunicola CBS 121167]